MYLFTPSYVCQVSRRQTAALFFVCFFLEESPKLLWLRKVSRKSRAVRRIHTSTKSRFVCTPRASLAPPPQSNPPCTAPTLFTPHLLLLPQSVLLDTINPSYGAAAKRESFASNVGLQLAVCMADRVWIIIFCSAV